MVAESRIIMADSGNGLRGVQIEEWTTESYQLSLDTSFVCSLTDVFSSVCSLIGVLPLVRLFIDWSSRIGSYISSLSYM